MVRKNVPKGNVPNGKSVTFGTLTDKIEILIIELDKGSERMHILLVEDNPSIAKGLKYSFEKNAYQLTWVTSIKEAKEFLENRENYKEKIDVILLDVALPDGNGFELFENTIKKLNIPTIFLTAKEEEDDIVKGLNMGAEDYITKPFSTKELLARINRVVLRSKKQSTIQINDVSFDMDKLILQKNGENIELTSLELKIVHLLFSNINKVVSRNTILDKIWEWTGNDVDDHTITIYLKRIREKIGTDIITTIKGIGYRIDEK